MARIRVPLNNFVFGEINPSLTSRIDSAVYNQAGQSVKNVFIRAEGGVINRPGTERLYNFSHTYDDTLRQQIRLEPFVFSSDEKYVVAFSSGQIDIFRINTDGTYNSKVATITQDVDANSLPIDNTNLTQFTYAQQGDFMFIAHNDFMPLELVRTGLTSFEVRVFSFDTSADGNRILQPYYNFQGTGVSITPSATSGTGVTVTTSSAYFDAGMVGSSLLIHETQVDITAVTSSTTATVDIQGTIQQQLDFDSLNTTEGSDKVRVIMPHHGLSTGDTIVISNAGALGGINNGNINGSRVIYSVIDANTFLYTAGGAASSTATGGGTPIISSTAGTTEWYEQSYSAYRGFPAAITFHENRLWFGGTPSQPSGIWASASGDFFNFDVGEGEDFDAIDLEVSVGVTNFIRHLVSNRDLQVFANQGEFYLPAFQDQPITASIAKVSEQTPFGTGYVRPLSLDGGTLFVQATGTAVREYIFNDTEGAYTTNMVSILSSHLISNPIQLTSVKGSLDRPGAYAFFLMDNGEVAVFYSIRAEKRAGWMRWTTEGRFHSVCAVDEQLFTVSVRDDGSGTNKLFLEQFNKDLNMDFSDDFTGTAGVFDVSAHFSNGAVVDVVDGTEYLGQFTVAGGNVDVSAVKLSTAAQIGYKFVPELTTMPIDGQVPGGPLTGRPRKITNVVLDVKDTLSISVNGTNMIIRNVNFNPAQPRIPFTGKKEFRVLGYSKDPIVTISQIAPLDMQLNGMVVEVAF
jgi:hypothetical protein